MKQQSFSDVEYSLRKRTTKREDFWDIMSEIIPRAEWASYIAPHYPMSKRGCPPMGIKKMLRIH